MNFKKYVLDSVEDTDPIFIYLSAKDLNYVTSVQDIPDKVDDQPVKYRFTTGKNYDIDVYSDPYKDHVYIMITAAESVQESLFTKEDMIPEDLKKSYITESAASYSDADIERCARSIARAKHKKLCNYDDISEVVEFTDYGSVIVALCDEDMDGDDCTDAIEFYPESEFWAYDQLNEELEEDSGSEESNYLINKIPVVKTFGKIVKHVGAFDSKAEAIDFCEKSDWKWVDPESGQKWTLVIESPITSSEDADYYWYTYLGNPTEDSYSITANRIIEDTVKQGNYWVNKGKEGTHGKFRTKKAADAQRKAMFACGYTESLTESTQEEKDFINTYFAGYLNYLKSTPRFENIKEVSLRYKGFDKAGHPQAWLTITADIPVDQNDENYFNYDLEDRSSGEATLSMYGEKQIKRDFIDIYAEDLGWLDPSDPTYAAININDALYVTNFGESDYDIESIQLDEYDTSFSYDYYPEHSYGFGNGWDPEDYDLSDMPEAIRATAEDIIVTRIDVENNTEAEEAK